MEKNRVTKEDVVQVAKLSRLEFTEAEEEKIRENLEEIVDYFSMLSEVDTKNITSTRKVADALREDEIKQGLTSSEVIKNAPKKNHNSFVVPRVVE